MAGGGLDVSRYGKLGGARGSLSHSLSTRLIPAYGLVDRSYRCALTRGLSVLG